jgi:phosphate:Na+ symporter
MEKQVYFLPEQRANLQKMNQLIIEAMDVMIENLAARDYKNISKFNASRVEKKINQLRNTLRSEYLLQVNNPEYNVHSGLVYNAVFMSLERIGDHVMNVTEAIVGEI